MQGCLVWVQKIEFFFIVSACEIISNNVVVPLYFTAYNKQSSSNIEKATPSYASNYVLGKNVPKQQRINSLKMKNISLEEFKAQNC